jgi:hypothetical protein
VWRLYGLCRRQEELCQLPAAGAVADSRCCLRRCQRWRLPRRWRRLRCCLPRRCLPRRCRRKQRQRPGQWPEPGPEAGAGGEGCITWAARVEALTCSRWTFLFLQPCWVLALGSGASQPHQLGHLASADARGPGNRLSVGLHFKERFQRWWWWCVWVCVCGCVGVCVWVWVWGGARREALQEGGLQAPTETSSCRVPLPGSQQALLSPATTRCAC